MFSHPLRRAALALVFFAASFPAIGQQFQVVPNQTVLGRIGIGSGSGPAQAIPFSSLPWTVGSTPINGGASGQILYDNAGKLGEYSASAARTYLGISGVYSAPCTAHQWIASIAAGVAACSQPSFSDLAGNIAVSQMSNGTNASLNTVFSGAGNWAEPQDYRYTAANASPSAQTIKGQLTKIPVSCEDFGTCGTSDDTTNVQAAVNYAAANGRCFQFNKTYTVTTIVVANAAHLCMTGKGGLIGKTGTTASAVLEIKDTIGTTIDGNITLNCNSQSGYGAGLKVWSDGLATGQFNPRISLAAIANCKLAAQYGDAVQPDNTFSENILKIGYTFNVAQGVKVIGVQAVLVITDSILVIDPTNWAGTTGYGLYSVGSAIQMIGGEIVTSVSSSSAAVRMEALTSSAYTNSYGNVHLSGTLVETYKAASIANPGAVTSPQFGAFQCINCYGIVLGDVGNAFIDAAADFIGSVTVTGSRFFAASARTQPNVSASSAKIFVDPSSFGSNMVQGFAGLSGGNRNMLSSANPSTTLQTSVSNPTGTASATGLMMGMGSTCKITPSSTGRVQVWFIGDDTNTSVNTDTRSVRYGTGTAPANATALAGTSFGNNTQVISTAGAPFSFHLGGIAFGLSIGTAYWFDMGLGTNGGTASLTNVTCTVVEF